jgi:DHA1 family tetracycline resistance protein-like MFS transporter
VRSGRASLVVVLAVVYVDMLGVGLAYPILPKLIEHFRGGDVSSASYLFGALSSVFSVMQFLFAPLIGVISDRFGRRVVILSGLFGSGAAYLVTAFAPNLAVLAMARVIAGFFGGSYSTAGAYIADVSPPEKRAANFGLIGAAFGFGFITGPVLGGMLGAIDLHLPFFVAGVLCFADLVFGYFVLPESLDAAHRKAFSWRRANPAGALGQIGRYTSVLGLIAIMALATFANRVSEMTWVLWTTYRFHWTATEIGISLGMVGVMFVVGQGVMVRLLLPRLGERRAVLMGLTVAMVGMIAYAFVTQGWMVYPLMVAGMFGWTIAQPAVQGMLSRAVPANEQGLLQGAVASVNSLTSIVGPPIWTSLFGFFVSPAAPFLFPGAAFLVAAFVFAIALIFAVRWLTAEHPVFASSTAVKQTSTSPAVPAPEIHAS